MSQQTRKITQGVADKILEGLHQKGLRSPKGYDYSINMVRNWLYGKVQDEPNIELVYLEIVATMEDTQVADEKKKMARMHLEMAEKLLTE